MENNRALARLREERDMAFGDTCPPRDLNTLTYNEVHGLADETPYTYGEITRHVKSWQRTQPCVEFREVVARNGDTFTCEAIYYQGPTSPPYIPETTPSLTAAAAAHIQEVLASPPTTATEIELPELPSDQEELVQYYLDKQRNEEPLRIEVSPAINPEDFRVEFPEEEPAPNDPGQDMSHIQLTALLSETDIYGDPVEEVETTEQAHSSEPLPTPPPVDNCPSGFAMIQHQPFQHHAHPVAPCSHIIELVRVFLPRSPSLEFTPMPPLIRKPAQNLTKLKCLNALFKASHSLFKAFKALFSKQLALNKALRHLSKLKSCATLLMLPIDPEEILGWMKNSTLLQELNNETKGKDSHAYLDLYTDIRTLAKHMNQINNEVLDLNDILKTTKETVERLEKRLKTVMAHKQVLLDQSKQLFQKFQNFLPIEQLRQYFSHPHGFQWNPVDSTKIQWNPLDSIIPKIKLFI